MGDKTPRLVKCLDLVLLGIAVGLMLAALTSCATPRKDHTFARPDDVDAEMQRRNHVMLLCDWILDDTLPDGRKVQRWLVCDYPERFSMPLQRPETASR